ncbi:MAG: D-alanyl-D-alanine carboxypeptidase [Parcubacteria group bacterium Gr01-1014_30]|nr:MAG: D-alanyl-D-alanine carboxypeptidase [Parcubacteria group bacterium Gr01-1014_30]
MNENLKVFFAAFLVSLPFWWGANLAQENLEDFLFWSRMADSPELLLAQAAQEESLAKQKPIRNRQVEEPFFEAESVISVFVDKEGQDRVLFAKNIDRPLPLASITKLMTALVVLEYYDLESSETARLLYSMLIASDNDAAGDLAEIVGKDAFLELMNYEAQKLGLSNTHFFNPSGLDLESEKSPELSDKINYSTTEDLVKLARYISEEHPLVWEISSITAFEGSVTTNELLQEFPKIIGGKTGKTDRAKECLLLVLKPKVGRGQVVNVILSSNDRFGDMRKLVEWVNSAYRW